MSHRLALLTLGVAAPLTLLTFVVPLPRGEVVFAIATVVFPLALMTLGASRGGSSGPVAGPLALLLLTLLAVVAGLFAFRGRVEHGPWWGGLPAAAALQIYGLLLLPFLLSSFGYAHSFERWTLRQDDLDTLRRRFPKPEENPDSEQEPRP